MKSSKGSSYERAISKRLSKWWTNDERDDVFWRSQQSGGRATQRAKKGKSTKNQEGDIQAMDPIGQPLIDKVSIELKCGYPDFGIDQIVQSRKQKPLVLDFIKQCKRESEPTNRDFWLIVKQDFKKEIVIYNRRFHSFLLSVNIRFKNYLCFCINNEHYFCTGLDDFLSLIDPESIKTKQ